MIVQEGNMDKCVCVCLTICAFALSCPAGTSDPNAAWNRQFGKVQGQHIESFKSVVVAFWDRDFPSYEMHKMIRGLIDQIDNDEMLAFLQKRGVPPTPQDMVTSQNLIAYWQYKKLGTPAAYAWLDLLKGNPNFVRAVLDWNAIRQERGFEFIPMYYLLFHAKLETKRDREIWADLFKTTFKTLTERDTDKKILMVFSALMRILGDLKEIEPPLVERFAFLAEELKKQQDLSQRYPQALLFALWEVNFAAHRFPEAAAHAGHLLPPTTGLYLSFISQVLAKDLEAATAIFSELEKADPENMKMLDGCRQMLRELKEMKHKQGSAQPQETRPWSALCRAFLFSCKRASVAMVGS
jgi:hypothetical protein